METPKIYVGTYSKYNNGSIAGKWLDLLDYSDKEEFYAACAELHSDETDPEYMFQDYENIPDSLICESLLSDNVFEYFQAIEDFNEPEAFAAFVSNYGYDLSESDMTDLSNKFNESYQGYYRTEGDYAYEIANETIDIPEHIAQYFDYEKYARILFMDGYTFIDGYVFADNF